MELSVFSLNHRRRFLTSEPLALYALSWDLQLESHENDKGQYSGKVRTARASWFRSAGLDLLLDRLGKMIVCNSALSLARLL
jgi:hypothetical protein